MVFKHKIPILTIFLKNEKEQIESPPIFPKQNKASTITIFSRNIRNYHSEPSNKIK